MSGTLQSFETHRRRGVRFKPRAEINVTPFVDVMLVLLIVFMVSAPLLTVGEPVDLPETPSPALSAPADPLVVTVTRTGAVFLQERELGVEDPESGEADEGSGDVADGQTDVFARGELLTRLEAIRTARAEGGEPVGRVLVRADGDARYEDVLVVLADLRAAGLNAGLVSRAYRPEEAEADADEDG